MQLWGMLTFKEQAESEERDKEPAVKESEGKPMSPSRWENNFTCEEVSNLRI